MCYIEQRFEELARRKDCAGSLSAKWKMDKAEYVSRIATTVFDFQHYSMHDKSHSIRILQNIELLLGRQRVDRLGVGDLWLLLQTAYFHDIGMALTSQDIHDFWSAEESRQFLSERLREGRYGDNMEIYDAIDYYRKADVLLSDQSKFEAAVLGEQSKLGADWPVQLTQSIQYIITEYTRQHHAKRSAAVFEKIFQKDETFVEGVIDQRLYELVGLISSLHTEDDYGKIIDRLCYEEVAVGDEHIHPRFAAAMLRIGDLLDMDNNRFDAKVLAHRGALPYKSEVHRKKHKALKHFEITQRQIIAWAQSKDFDTCFETRNWYNWIEAEVRDLTQNWNRLAPPALRGCQLEDCDLRVYLGDRLFTTRNLNHFNFDSRKMHKLLIGDSIYDCRLDCLREYVQNAIDATKVWMWKLLRRGGIDCPIKNKDHSSNVRFDELLPMDLEESALLRVPIEVALSYEEVGGGIVSDKIRIEIKDRGIGMDKNCIEGITTIGKGWRSRDEYQEVFDLAPKWLQPTGGFGIGIQSAFMITDEVEYETRSESEETGHHIRLISPQRSGNVAQEDFNYGDFHGTTVSFQVDVMKFMDLDALSLGGQFIQRLNARLGRDVLTTDRDKMVDTFNRVKILERAILICEEYLCWQIPSPIFPIYVGEKGSRLKRITSPFLYVQKEEEMAREPLNMLEFQEESVRDPNTGVTYRYLYHIDLEQTGKDPSSQIIIWNTRYNDCAYLRFGPSRSPEGKLSDQAAVKRPLTVAFKNILVPKENLECVGCEVFLDILGERAGSCLKVSRSQLNNDFYEKLWARITDYLHFGLDRLMRRYIAEKRSEQKRTYDDQVKSNMAIRVNPSDIAAGVGFVQMVFCRLAYLPLERDDPWWRQFEDIQYFGQETLDKLGRSMVVTEDESGEIDDPLNTPTDEDVEDMLNTPIDEEDWDDASVSRDDIADGQADVLTGPKNRLVTLIERMLDGSKPEMYFCVNTLRTVSVDDDYTPDEGEGQVGLKDVYERLNKIYAQQGKGRGELYNYELYELLIHLLRETREPVFDALWERAVFGSGLGRWKGYRRIVINSFQASPSIPDIYFLPLTIYLPADESEKPEDEGEPGAQQIRENDRELMEAYPELAVNRAPFCPAVSNDGWMHIPPFYQDLNKKLIDLHKERPIQVEERIIKLLEEDPKIAALVEWVYRYQIKRDGDHYSKGAIKKAYQRWVLDYYKSKI